jgi:acetyl-CoA acetyltransferase
MEHYAAKGQDYLDRTGATEEDLALLVVKSRRFGSLNPRAHFTKETTVEEVLGGRLINAPLRMAMCAPLSNGAAAVVVMSEAAARARGRDQVRVLGVSVRSNDPGSGTSPTAAASREAFERAGVGPEDVDFAEVHDAAAPAELIIMEELGLAAHGTAFKMLRNGETGLGGSLPINASGGLLSRGHPIGATGCAQVVELADQLRGRSGRRQVDGARIGLAQNGGGVLEGDEATVTVSVLERVRS